jgi:hypothetical protein
MNQEGKLNPEQFALAMYLVQQKQAGKDPPAALTPDMVPPSMRPKGAAGGGAEAGKSVYNNPELEAMARYVPPWIRIFFGNRIRIIFEIPENLMHFSSVADPCHFGVDPDPRIHASD